MGSGDGFAGRSISDTLSLVNSESLIPVCKKTSRIALSLIEALEASRSAVCCQTIKIENEN